MATLPKTQYVTPTPPAPITTTATTTTTTGPPSVAVKPNPPATIATTIPAVGTPSAGPPPAVPTSPAPAETPKEVSLADQGYVTYEQFSINNMSCTPPEQKQIPKSDPPTYYKIIPLMYNFGTTEQKILRDFQLEGPELHSSYGVSTRMTQYGKEESSIMVRLDMRELNQMNFCETIDQVHRGGAFIIGQYKGPLKMYDFNPNSPGSLFKNPIYRPRDEMTGEQIPGRSPVVYLKLFKFGKPPFGEQTLFTDLDGKKISWDLLQNVEMKFVPLLHFRRIYVGGGKCVLQFVVASAIVTSIRPRNTFTAQTSTLARLRAERPDLQSQVSDQLARLTAERQSSKMVDVSEEKDETEGEPSKSTFDGITPTGALPGIPDQTEGALSGVPAIGTQDMQTFTANAPTRTEGTLQLN